MCGIFAVLSSNIKENGEFEKQNFHKGKNRGPESSVFKKVNNNILFGFHRLAINGYTNPLSEQPIELEDCVLICNGEIYNWKYFCVFKYYIKRLIFSAESRFLNFVLLVR